jgi:hypothetical protein
MPKYLLLLLILSAVLTVRSQQPPTSQPQLAQIKTPYVSPAAQVVVIDPAITNLQLPWQQDFPPDPGTHPEAKNRFINEFWRSILIGAVTGAVAALVAKSLH